MDSGALVEGVCEEDAIAGICSRGRSWRLGDGKREEEGREEKIEGQKTGKHGSLGIWREARKWVFLLEGEGD